MNKLRKNRVRSVLQAISLLLGLLGISSICFAVYFFFCSFSEKEYLGLVSAFVGLLIGYYLIFTAYLMIRKFSELHTPEQSSRPIRSKVATHSGAK